MIAPQEMIAVPHPDPIDATVLTGKGADPLPWADVRDRLAGASTAWFSSLHPSGRPHVRPVFTVWVDGTLHSTSNAVARKARNLRADGHCSISVTTDDMDLVLEGVAHRVIDPAHLERIRAAYVDKYGWPITVNDDGGAFDAPYAAPTAGTPPYEPWEIVPTAVYAFGTAEDLYDRATRFRF